MTRTDKVVGLAATLILLFTLTSAPRRPNSQVLAAEA